ncbi:MAG: SrtB family sortase [Clostridiales bacterium]|nr:SrtB family sortase [Clostridiales bacterium]
MDAQGVLIMKKNIRSIIKYLSGIIFVCCVIYLSVYFINGYKSQKDIETLAKRLKIAEALHQQQTIVSDLPVVEATIDDEVPTLELPEVEPTILPKFVELHNENPDLIGWINIEDTKVDYPVMQTKEDNEFYLRRNFEKESDRGGLPFLDNRSTIHFDTIYEESEYEIVAVFLSQIYKVDDDVFKYYKFFQANTEKEYNDFIDNVKNLSLYDTGIHAEYGDQLITLSTCEYSNENGRFAIVARKKAQKK